MIFTPVYDPFKERLELRMLFDELQDLPDYRSAFESVGTTIAFMDEARYELEPF